jgi:hypothetical protein
MGLRIVRCDRKNENRKEKKEKEDVILSSGGAVRGTLRERAARMKQTGAHRMHAVHTVFSTAEVMQSDVRSLRAPSALPNDDIVRRPEQDRG